jgi:hypothetical protein
MTLPPGPAEPPAIQTARWLLRPISFMESCRRRFGEAFSVRFLGFTTPMVIGRYSPETQSLRRLELEPRQQREAVRTVGRQLESIRKLRIQCGQHFGGVGRELDQ